MFQPAPLIIPQLHPQLFLPLAGFDLPPVAGAGSSRQLWPRHGRGCCSRSGAPPAGEQTAGSGGSGSHATVEQKLRGGKGGRARAAGARQPHANAVEKLTACEGAGSASPSCSGAVSSRAFAASLFPPPPPQYLIPSEKPFHDVSAEPAPEQPGSRWLAGREVLSGKQSCKNQKGIYFPIYKARPLRDVQRCLVAGAGAEV